MQAQQGKLGGPRGGGPRGRGGNLLATTSAASLAGQRSGRFSSQHDEGEAADSESGGWLGRRRRSSRGGDLWDGDAEGEDDGDGLSPGRPSRTRSSSCTAGSRRPSTLVGEGLLSSTEAQAVSSETLSVPAHFSQCMRSVRWSIEYGDVDFASLRGADETDVSRGRDVEVHIERMLGL